MITKQARVVGASRALSCRPPDTQRDEFDDASAAIVGQLIAEVDEGREQAEKEARLLPPVLRRIRLQIARARMAAPLDDPGRDGFMVEQAWRDFGTLGFPPSSVRV